MIIKKLGIIDYQTCLKKMQDFSKNRNQNTADEFWLVQHNSVFTQGIKDSQQHLLKNPNHIPFVKTDRGGQITYHGLGQIIIYCLIDLNRAKITVRQFIFKLEQIIINLLAHYQILANRQDNMPGVYVNGNKIAALGLKVSHGNTYHGLSLNVDMDLTPFDYINPCGHKALKITQMSHLITPCPDIDNIANNLLAYLR